MRNTVVPLHSRHRCILHRYIHITLTASYVGIVFTMCFHEQVRQFIGQLHSWGRVRCDMRLNISLILFFAVPFVFALPVFVRILSLALPPSVRLRSVWMVALPLPSALECVADRYFPWKARILYISQPSHACSRHCEHHHVGVGIQQNMTLIECRQRYHWSRPWLCTRFR